MKRIPLLVVALLAFGVGAAHDLKAQSVTKIKALIPLRSIDESFSPMVVAKHLGYFEQEGLDVTFLAIAGSNEIAIQISAGNADVGAASPAEAIIGLQSDKNLNIKYFYNLYYRNIWSISVLPDSPIQSTKDIKGKKLGVIGMGSAGVSLGRAFAKEAGLDPDKDITFIPVGVGAQAMTAVRQKLVDALVFPDNILTRFILSGMELRILPTSDRLTNLPDVSLLTRREVIERNPKMLIGYARAVAKGYIFTMANPAAAVKITWKHYPEAVPANVAPEEALRQGVIANQTRMALWGSDKIGGLYGKFIDADWESRVSFMQDQGLLKEQVPIDRIYTNALIEEINKFDRKAVIDQAKSFNIDSLK